METMVLLYFYILLVSQCDAVIYKLNDSDYSRMPPVFHLDDYDPCVTNPVGVYCTVDIQIVAEPANELYTMMREYSAYDRKHYNHTLLHHGICVTQSCKSFLQNNTDMKLVIEACLNKSLWENYQLRTRISDPIYCSNTERRNQDGGDFAIAIYLLVLLILNVVGSVYDMIVVKENNKSGKCNDFLLCFSVWRNFSRLITSYENLQSREKRLKAFHGLRTMTIMCVIFCHSLLPFAIGPENHRHIETLYDNIMHFIFINGTLVVQTFFMISGCLLSYKLEIYAERHKIKWTLLPKMLIATWIKLTPSYLVVLALTATWLKHAGSGPFWEVAVMKEVNDCRANGWANALYVNNYIDHSQCMVHCWYLGANMQLYFIGFFVCILGGRYKKAILILLFIVGLVTPMAHTYFQDLDAVLMITPETARTFMDSPTFDYVYKRGHTNIVNFIMGIALGHFIYRLQTKEVNLERFRKYHYLFLLTFPGIIGSMFLGSVFYVDGFKTSIYTKALYSGLIKPMYGVILAALIFGTVFKIENVYRPLLEWHVWKVLARLSYCAFLLHICLVRAATGRGRTLIPFSNFRMIEQSLAFITMSFLAAVPFWILIDAPVTQCLLNLLNGRTSRKKEETERITPLEDVYTK